MINWDRCCAYHVTLEDRRPGTCGSQIFHGNEACCPACPDLEAWNADDEDGE